MTGSPVGTSHFCFLLLLHLYSGCFFGTLSVVPWFSSLFLSLEFSLSPFVFLFGSYLSLLGSVLRSIFSAFSFRSTVLDYFVALVLPVLCFSSVFLCGVFCGFIHSLGVLPVFLSRIVPSCFVLTALVAALFRCALILPCASSSYCLFRPCVLPLLPCSWFVSPRSPSLFRSTLHFLSLSWGYSCHFSFRLFFGSGSLPLVFAGRSHLTGSFSNPLPCSFCVRSFCDLWVLFWWRSFCALFVHFVPPSRVLLAVPSRPHSLCRLSSFFFPFSCSGRFRFLLFVFLFSGSCICLLFVSSSFRFLSVGVLALLLLFSSAQCSRCCGFCGFSSRCSSFFLSGVGQGLRF